MRNVLLIGASTLALSLSAIGAFAQQQPYAGNPGSWHNDGQYDTQDVYHPSAVLGVQTGNNELNYAYPDHQDARSQGR